MNLTVIGSGYVGLVSGVCFAELGIKVTCVDNNPDKIALLSRAKSPIYEPKLDELLASNIEQGRLFFTTDLEASLLDADAALIAVGTPTKADGSIDLSYIFQAATEIKQFATKNLAVIIKSTVPTGTNQLITDLFTDNPHQFHIISNPEFLREGLAINDFLYPDRIVIGVRDEISKQIMTEMYQHFIDRKVRIFFTTPESAELAKYAANGFLATKIAFINEIADLCDQVGADVKSVSEIIGSDHRIGDKFLQPGPGYGGSCFPKDTLALLEIADKSSVSLSIINAVIASNHRRYQQLADKIIVSSPDAKTITCLGLTFKANTDDIRESPAIAVIEQLAAIGLAIRIYDPQGMENARSVLQANNYYFCDSPEQAVEGADSLVILTEWEEFKSLSYSKIYHMMHKPVIFDYRNLLSGATMKKLGFQYYNLGNYGSSDE